MAGIAFDYLAGAVSQSHCNGAYAADAIFWSVNSMLNPVRNRGNLHFRSSFPPTANACRLIHVSGQRMQSISTGCRTSEAFRKVYVARQFPWS